MKSLPAKAFLSCSFRPEDQDVNSYFNAICQGLDIHCANVAEGYQEVPPQKAKEMIGDSQMTIAIAVRRGRDTDGNYLMPEAVHDEISMAYAKEKPLLLLKEEGVSTKGFLGNYGTFLEFKREDITKPEFLKKAVLSIHALKMGAVSSQDLVPEQDTRGFYQDKVRALYELVPVNGQFTWRYYTSRRLVFTQKFSNVVRNSAWAPIPPEGIKPEERIKWDVSLKGGSKNFQMKKYVDQDTPQCVEVSLSFEPDPEKGDYIDIDQVFESPHLNRITLPQGADVKPYLIGNKAYHCFDGFVPICRTRELRLQMRFPKEYGLRKEALFPFVGSYCAGIDYLVESEIKRSDIQIDDFGGNLLFNLTVESPLLRHIYGIAWRIPQ